MQKLQKNRDDVIRILKYTQYAQSIEVLVEQEFENEICLSDYSQFENSMIEKIQASQETHLISQLLKLLTEKEKAIIEMRYGFWDGTCWTLEKCGMYYGLTRERIRQIERKALKKLKSPIYVNKLLDFEE